MAAGATTVIDIVAEVTDNTAAGTESAEKNVSKLEKSVEKLQSRLSGMKGKSKLEVKAELKDMASKGLTGIWNTGKKLAGTAWKVTVTLADLATAPLKKLIDVAKNPITQAVAFTGVSVGATDTLNTYKSFEQGMANVKAISGATGEQFDALVEKAKELGETTQFSASEVAEAMENTAMAGWDPSQITSQMQGLLDLAAAGSVDLATASDVVASAIAQFGMKDQKNAASEIADVLAATATSTKTDIEGLGESLKYVGPLAGSLGFNIKDVSIALGVMGNSAIDAGSAGTALRSLFTRMAKDGSLTEEETNEVAAAMKKVGVSMTDGAGKAKPLRQILRDLRTGFSGLSESEKTQVAASLAGQEAMSGLLAIVNASEDDFNDITEAIDNSAGAAKNMANTKMDSLEGSLKYLQSAAEGVQISIGEQVSPYIREAVDAVTAAMPEIQEALGSVIEWITGKIDNVKTLLSNMFNSDEWENADFGGKLDIAWDTLIAEPFQKWWDGTGKRTIFTAIGDLFSNAAEIFPGGEEPDFSSWISATAIVEAAKPAVDAISSVLKVLNQIDPALSKWGIAATVIGLAVGGIATAIESYNAIEVSDNLVEHFGELELSAQEAKEIAGEILTVPWKADVELSLNEIKNAEELRSQAEEKLKNMEKIPWEAKITANGVMSDEDWGALMESATSYADSMIAALESETYAAHINTQLFLGGTEEGAELDANITKWAQEDLANLESLKEQISSTINDALQDGIYDVDEQAAVAALQEKMNNIVNGWYESESQAKMDLIRNKFGGMSAEELTEGGFRELMTALNDENETQEAKIDSDYTNTMSQYHSLHNSGKITDSEMETYERIANRTRLNQELSSRGTSLEIATNTANEAYSDKVKENRGAIQNTMQETVGNLSSLVEFGEEGTFLDTLQSQQTALSQGNGKEGFWSFFGTRVTDEDQAGLNSLLDVFQPDAKKYQNLIDQYAETGEAIPQAFMDSYYSAMELMASAGDSDAALQLYAKGIADSGDQALIDAVNDADKQGLLNEALSAAWHRALLETTDEEAEIDSPKFKMKDPDVENKDEWLSKVNKITKNLEESGKFEVDEASTTATEMGFTVKPGNTLSEIGNLVGMSYQDLADYNGISNPDLIYPDQVIKIPLDKVQLDTSGLDQAMAQATEELQTEGFGTEITTSGLQVTLGDVEVDPADALAKIAEAVGTSVEALQAAGITEETIEAGVAITIPPELITVDTSGIQDALEESDTGEGGLDAGDAEAKADINVEPGDINTEKALDETKSEVQEDYQETTFPATGNVEADLSQTNNADEIYNETSSEVQGKYSKPIAVDTRVNVNLDWKILNPNKTISVTGAGTGNSNLKAQFNAEGNYIDSPVLSVVGEDGPEYIVPVGSKHRDRGLKLWQQAGHDLGIPGFAEGGIVGYREPAEDYDDYDNEREPIIDDTDGNTQYAGSPSVTIENLQFDVNIDGTGAADPEEIVRLIKEHIPDMTDEICYHIGVAAQQVYTNTAINGR